MLCRLKCESVNVGPPLTDGRVECEMFATFMHKALPQEISLHPNWTLLSIQHEPCERKPCGEGLCSPKYKKNDYSCKCPQGTYGKNCEFRIANDLKPPNLSVIKVTNVSMKNPDLAPNNMTTLEVDGDENTCALSLNGNGYAWLRVDFGELTFIQHVEITPPADPKANLFGANIIVVNDTRPHYFRKVQGDSLASNCWSTIGTHVVVKCKISLKLYKIVVRGVYAGSF